MKLRADNHIELSYANAKALVQEYERKVAEGRTPHAMIYRGIDGQTVAVSIVSDEEHYSPEELERRRSPYLPPEAWAGV